MGLSMDEQLLGSPVEQEGENSTLTLNQTVSSFPLDSIHTATTCIGVNVVNPEDNDKECQGSIDMQDYGSIMHSFN